MAFTKEKTKTKTKTGEVMSKKSGGPQVTLNPRLLNS